MPLTASGLGTRLLLVVLLAIVPGSAFMLYNAVEAHRRDIATAQENTLRLARLLSADQERLIEGAQHLLIAFAQVPAVRRGDPTECNALAADISSQYSVYANLGAITPDGQIFCSALPLSAPVNVADRAYFQRAVQTRRFAVGEYQISRITQRATLNFGYPALDERGELQAVVFAALDLTWLTPFLREAQLPDGTVVLVIDRDGIILAHYPELARKVGNPLPEAPLVAAVRDQGEGSLEATGEDGIARLYGFTPLRGTAGQAYVVVGIPRASVGAVADRTFAGNLALLGLITVVAFGLARFGGEKLVRRPVARVLTATQQQADYDPLTGLFSRSLFLHRLQLALKRPDVRPDSVAVLYLDLDHFRQINETFGHPAGDQVLALVGQRLPACVRLSDTVARLGSDEFIILLEGITGPRDAAGVAQRILDSVRAPFHIEGHQIALTASIGIALGSSGHNEADALVRDANSALYRAKAAGRNCYFLFAPHEGTPPLSQVNQGAD